MWEYLTLNVTLQHGGAYQGQSGDRTFRGSLDDILNQLSKEGWELASSTPSALNSASADGGPAFDVIGFLFIFRQQRSK